MRLSRDFGSGKASRNNEFRKKTKVGGMGRKENYIFC
jgi:hypothetical protein